MVLTVDLKLLDDERRQVSVNLLELQDAQ